jgi:hypothetical protein
LDGEAPSYQQYGLRHFAKTDYRRVGAGQIAATINVFEFDAPLGAFGRYTLMVTSGRDPATLEPQAVAIGGGGYQGTSQLNFWRGRHLVQISVTDLSDDPNEQAVATAARDVLPRLAAAVARLIPDAPLAATSPLPSAMNGADARVWGGESYLADGAFGVEQTGPAWVGHYGTAAHQRYRLGVFTRPSAAEAQRVVTRFRAAGAAAIRGLGDEAFAVTLPNDGGEVVVARRGATVFVVGDAGAPGLVSLDRAGKTAVARAALASPTAGTSADAGAR